MPVGAVRSFDGKRGAGFIAPDDGEPDIFVHSAEVERAGIARLKAGDRVSYDVQTDRALKRSFATNLVLLPPSEHLPGGV
ncbi:cold shock protein CspA [alpha proteobacterium U9-1i]|nr:cold shock protein CspA [alpha proteobacterium U9-1i]